MVCSTTAVRSPGCQPADTSAGDAAAAPGAAAAMPPTTAAAASTETARRPGDRLVLIDPCFLSGDGAGGAVLLVERVVLSSPGAGVRVERVCGWSGPGPSRARVSGAR
ncbi:hypothetical protein GCM10023340_15190 [Nocardioides marinquilinus]|uniref:Uncharacterized protein n=1 Tax=Nocardioides marinquilinus TaxID=1210400 RepID=A0ABP9PIU0_9ACTN